MVLRSWNVHGGGQGGFRAIALDCPSFLSTIAGDFSPLVSHGTNLLYWGYCEQPIPVYRGRAGQGPPSPDFDAEMKRLFQAEDEGDFEDDEVEERGLSLALVEEGGAVVTAEAQVSSPAPMVAARGREPTARSRSRSRSKSRAGGGGCRKRRGCLSKSILQARKELDMLLARLQLKPDPWSACQLRPSSSFTP